MGRIVNDDQPPPAALRFGNPLAFGGSSPRATGDFNNDGRTDLVVTSSAGVSARLGNGDGTFRPPGATTATAAVNGLATAEVNRDGKLDLVMASSSSTAAVGILLGNGDGTFRPGRAYALPLMGPLPFSKPSAQVAADVTVGDVNSDGMTDLIVRGTQSYAAPRIGGTKEYANVFLGRGDGSFDSGVAAAVIDRRAGIALYPAVHPTVVADFTGDGRPDVLMDGSLLAGDRTARLGSPVAVAPGLLGQLATGDVNSDGKLDLVRTGPGVVGVYLNNGDGTFRAGQTLVTDATTAGAALVADFDRDGRLDILTAGNVATTVLRGNGDGTFRPAETVAPAGNPTLVADVNGDGLPDLLDATAVRLNLGTW